MPRPTTRAFLAYNLGRLGLLAVCLGLGALAGLRGLLLFAAALLVSGVLSWFLLARQRMAMGAAVEQVVARGRDKVAARTAAEDAYVDRLLSGSEGTAEKTADITHTER